MKDISATVIVDLIGKNEEELFKNLEYTRRKNVKKAIKSGLYVEDAGSEKDYKNCYKMYARIIQEGGSTPFPYSIWRNWSTSENWKLFAIKKGEKSIGYFSVIPITRKYYGLDSEEKGVRPRVFASDKKYQQYRTNDFIYWNTILYGLKERVNFVDLGGYQIKPRGHLKEVNQFKERWGGKVFYYYRDYPILTAVGRKLVRNVGLFWQINEMLKKRKPKIPECF
ncbi:peptidoglycan bridge formation glycyltransferase FemA/FemB family protein [Candidatus Pacearchaeota archaeon]|nr:peptidoglycan bridge formation glycyltransferase FemA/FemB family protein [Candidatus Pacearchaeota archaeon]